MDVGMQIKLEMGPIREELSKVTSDDLCGPPSAPFPALFLCSRLQLSRNRAGELDQQLRVHLQRT